MRFVQSEILKTILYIVLIVLSTLGHAQELKQVTILPTAVDEASGLEHHNSLFWMHNDDTQSILYGVDSSGATKRVVHVGVRNRDWEDISMDQEGRLYIGAFGNNRHSRKDLKIYIIPNPDSIRDPIIMPEIIEFSYSDQTAFPPAKAQLNFDAEAMVVNGDYIYIFSKNWTQPFDGICKMYRLPNEPGKHVAELMGEIFVGTGPKMENWITAADLSPDGTKLALLTHNKILLFTGFEQDRFFEGDQKVIRLNHFTQKEGLTFSDNQTLYIVDERSDFGLGGKLYKIEIE